MSYTALYRKFRPTDLSQVRGQDHIVTTLRNQLASGRVGHAYLFTGTRGTGKTSIAKIMARAVNCEHPTENGPCGECDSCRSIADGSSMNVYEIDAASNNGVDNVRVIIEGVNYRPTLGKYKVYIIDEVHMLSDSAFNALLKTLEEPPEWAIFILATTEVHKLPATILSRCQRYDFKRIGIDTICSRMQELMEAEGRRADEKALRYIARKADGSMRDALSLLDQAIAFQSEGELSYDKTLEVLGAVDTEVFSRLFRGIINRDTLGITGKGTYTVRYGLCLVSEEHNADHRIARYGIDDRHLHREYGQAPRRCGNVRARQCHQIHKGILRAHLADKICIPKKSTC